MCSWVRMPGATSLGWTNALDNFPERIEKAENRLGTLIQQRDAAQAELGKPFPQEDELAAKSARLAELDALLNMEDSPSQEAPGEEKAEAKEEGPQAFRAGRAESCGA